MTEWGPDETFDASEGKYAHKMEDTMEEKEIVERMCWHCGSSDWKWRQDEDVPELWWCVCANPDCEMELFDYPWDIDGEVDDEMAEDDSMPVDGDTEEVCQCDGNCDDCERKSPEERSATEAIAAISKTVR